jgi:hypothetical protein
MGVEVPWVAKFTRSVGQTSTSWPSVGQSVVYIMTSSKLFHQHFSSLRWRKSWPSRLWRNVVSRLTACAPVSSNQFNHLISIVLSLERIPVPQRTKCCRVDKRLRSSSGSLVFSRSCWPCPTGRRWSGQHAEQKCNQSWFRPREIVGLCVTYRKNIGTRSLVK